MTNSKSTPPASARPDRKSFHVHGMDSETIRLIRIVASARCCTIASVIERAMAETVGSLETWNAGMAAWTERRTEVHTLRREGR
jgi:hypothetical protein